MAQISKHELIQAIEHQTTTLSKHNEYQVDRIIFEIKRGVSGIVIMLSGIGFAVCFGCMSLGAHRLRDMEMLGIPLMIFAIVGFFSTVFMLAAIASRPQRAGNSEAEQRALRAMLPRQARVIVTPPPKS